MVRLYRIGIANFATAVRKKQKKKGKNLSSLSTAAQSDTVINPQGTVAWEPKQPICKQDQQKPNFDFMVLLSISVISVCEKID